MARTFGKSPETPLSIQSLSLEEIRNNPGGTFDISKVIQALPGVGGASGGASFRNDITIRGGGPNENVYYLDGVEIPQINHFATQGSAGGPAGILNVSFIEEVEVSSSRQLIIGCIFFHHIVEKNSIFCTAQCLRVEGNRIISFLRNLKYFYCVFSLPYFRSYGTL